MPAHFKSKFSAHTVQRGESIEFACEAYGEFPVSMQVAKDRMPLDFGSTFDRLPSDPLLEQQILHTDNRYHLLRRVTGQSDRAITSYIVRIANVDRRDSSLFTCLASNNFGKDEYNFQLIVQGNFDQKLEQSLNFFLFQFQNHPGNQKMFMCWN